MVVDVPDPSRYSRANCEAFAGYIRQRRLDNLGGPYLYDNDGMHTLTVY